MSHDHYPDQITLNVMDPKSQIYMGLNCCPEGYKRYMGCVVGLNKVSKVNEQQHVGGFSSSASLRLELVGKYGFLI